MYVNIKLCATPQLLYKSFTIQAFIWNIVYLYIYIVPFDAQNVFFSFENINNKKLTVHTLF